MKPKPIPASLRNPTIVPMPIRFAAMKDHVVAIIDFEDGSTFALRFVSPEHLATFFDELMKKAVMVWSDHPLIQEYRK